MAVDATHLNLFQPQLIHGNNNNNFVNMQAKGGDDVLYNNNNNVNNQQMRYSGIIPMNNTTTLPTTNYNNVYQTTLCESLQAKTSINTDSGLTYNSRKRSRDFSYAAAQNNLHMSPQKNNVNQLPSFVGEDFLPQIQQHQLEIDAIISQHTKKMRLELEERQKQQTRLLASAIGEGVMKKLKEKDEQIQRMSKMNFVLQERVKSLFVENQLWRDVAQSNEATANSLRSNLEQVMAHVGGVGDVEEEAESCCGSCSDDGNKEICSNNNNNKYSLRFLYIFTLLFKTHLFTIFTLFTFQSLIITFPIIFLHTFTFILPLSYTLLITTTHFLLFLTQNNFFLQTIIYLNLPKNYQMGRFKTYRGSIARDVVKMNRPFYFYHADTFVYVTFVGVGHKSCKRAQSVTLS